MGTIYAVIWTDNMLGHLTLRHSAPELAIETAQAMHTKGADKIHNLRAVELTPEDKLITLWSA